MLLHIDVKNKVANYRKRDGCIVCGNSDYQIKFTFDNEWDAATNKTARFIWGGQYTDVTFTGDTCNVPIITNADSVEIGVYAGNLRTTTSAQISCLKSILCLSATPNTGNGNTYGGAGLATMTQAEFNALTKSNLQALYVQGVRLIAVETYGSSSGSGDSGSNSGSGSGSGSGTVDGDNKVGSSIDTDGQPFNGGKGWIGSTRLSSGGVTKGGLEGEYTSTTGYIKASSGAIVRIKGVAWDNAGKCYVCSYNSKFECIAAVNSDGVYGGGTVTREEGVAVVTLPDNSDIEYIRVSASHTLGDKEGPGSYLIVTVDGVDTGSTPGTPTGDNLVASSVDEYGQPFNNGKGWIGNTRLSSSGGTKGGNDGNYSSTTGFIKAEKEDVIKLKGAAFAAGTEYVCVYDASHSLLGYITGVETSTPIGSAVANGDLTTVTLADNSRIAWIRVSLMHDDGDAGYFTVPDPLEGPGSYMIVTIEKESTEA